MHIHTHLWPSKIRPTMSKKLNKQENLRYEEKKKFLLVFNDIGTSNTYKRVKYHCKYYKLSDKSH